MSKLPQVNSLLTSVDGIEVEGIRVQEVSEDAYEDQPSCGFAEEQVSKAVQSPLHEAISGRLSNRTTNVSEIGKRTRQMLRRPTSGSSRGMPQMCGDDAVKPECWGITREQLKHLRKRLLQEPTWVKENNVYTLVHDFIIPWTSETGLGYALLQNQDDPKEVNLMVSHAWAENAEDFLDSLLRSTTNEDVLFICALSLYQAEDSAGPTVLQQMGDVPSESPFRRVLSHIHRRGSECGWRWRRRRVIFALPLILLCLAIVTFFLPAMLLGCVPTSSGCLSPSGALHLSMLLDGDEDPQKDSTRSRYSFHSWQLCLVWAPSAILTILAVITQLMLRKNKIYNGRMVVVPNREVDVYTRLWCVYEIFVASKLRLPVEVACTEASAGNVSSRYATCAKVEDEERIHTELQEMTHSYENIDRHVRRTIGAVRLDVRSSVGFGLATAFLDSAFLLIRGMPLSAAAMSAATFVANTKIALLMCRVFRVAQGRPSRAAVGVCAAQLLGAGAVMLAAGTLLSPSFGKACLFLMGLDLSLGGLYVGVFLVCSFGNIRCSRRRGTTALLLSTLAAFSSALALELADSPNPHDHLTPAVVSALALTMCHFVVPACAIYSAMVNWGFMPVKGRCITSWCGF